MASAHVDPRRRTGTERPESGRPGPQSVPPDPRANARPADAADSGGVIPPPSDLPAGGPARGGAGPALSAHRVARSVGLRPLRFADDPERPQAPAGTVFPGLRRP